MQSVRRTDLELQEVERPEPPPGGRVNVQRDPNVKIVWLKPDCLIPCVIGIAVLGSPLAHGEAPALDAAALGKADALLSYCTKVAPASRQEHWTQVKALSKDASKEQLSAARRSEEYLKAHQAVDDFVAKVDQHNTKLVCSQHVPARK